MNGSRHPARGLLLAAALAVAAAVVLLLPLPAWLQFVFLAPLALVLPGYALSYALFPPGTLPIAERCVYVFVLSLSVAAMGGVVLQLVFGLDQALWALLEVTVTLVAVAVALRRRALLPIQKPGADRLSAGARRQGARYGLLAALGFALAAALAVFAVASASDGVREQQARQVFASLWAVPLGGEVGEPVPVRVGVWNHGARSSYRLRVTGGEQILEQIPVRLGARQKWEQTLTPPPDAATGDLELTLFRGVKPYRSVVLNIGVGR